MDDTANAALATKDPVNILLVDDQPGKLLSYEIILADLGENLIRANSGNEALGQLLKTDFAVVLVDVCMPELDGFELASMIRQHPRLQKTAIILVSGVFVEDAHRLKGYDSGAVDYVSVPIIPEILRAKVSVFADRFRRNEELQRLNRELEERVAARTQEIEATADRLRQSEERLRVALLHAEQARAEAERANGLKDQFLAVLSHELRSPLSAIMGWVDVLRASGPDPATLKKAVDTISRNAQLQTRIISDILDVSSIVAGTLRLELETVDVHKPIAAALDTLRPAAQAKQVAIEIDDCAGDDAKVVGDPVRLQQVVWNVCSNSVQFAPVGGRLSVRIEASPRDVTIRVQDDGPGISPEFLPHVFDRFRQQDSTSKRLHGGLGLGLAIVKHLVDLHGGAVEVSNRRDRSGAVATIVLPKKSAAPATASIAPPPQDPPAEDAEPNWLDAAPRLDGIHVLVVDDAQDTLEVLAEILRRCGAQISVAACVADAFRELEAAPPHVIVTDIEMPGEDGYGLLRKLRALPAERGGAIPVAALTAYAGEQDRVNALAAGFAMHIAKPARPLELVRSVAALADPARC
jgi:signal transduction histidine kinase